MVLAWDRSQHALPRLRSGRGFAGHDKNAIVTRQVLPYVRIAAYALRRTAAPLKACIAQLSHEARHEALRWLRANGPEGGGKNVQHLVDTPVSAWFLSCGELSIMNPQDYKGAFWSEPKHQDGGASVLHMGITLYGRREVRFDQGEGSRGLD